VYLLNLFSEFIHLLIDELIPRIVFSMHKITQHMIHIPALCCLMTIHP